jgi:hypothetical protein
MKTLNSEKSIEVFNVYSLTTEEMICVKGGDGGEPVYKPSTPPVKI